VPVAVGDGDSEARFTIPAVLRGGNHEAIRRWRLKQALGRTWRRRPDLLDRKNLDKEQQALLREFIEEFGTEKT